MNQVITREAVTIGLRLRNRRNRELLVDLLNGHEVVDLDDPIPARVDLCVVDVPAFRRLAGALADWKREQQPVHAPVLLLAEGGGPDHWSRFGDALGATLDAILQVPVPRAAILARIDSLLETRRYARALATERKLVDRIFATSPTANIVLDATGTIVRANRRAEAVLGVDASEIEGQAYDDLGWGIQDSDGDSVAPDELPFDQVMSSGEPVYGAELGLTRPDGEFAWLSVNMAPILDARGAIEYLVTAIDDITVERRLERELRASEELHRTTLENISDTVVITDDEGAFTYVCPNTQHIFGHSAEEVEAIGHIAALLGRDPAPDDLDEVGLIENIELEITAADGTGHVVLVTVKAVSIQEGSRLYSVRDITRRAEMGRSLQEAMESRSLALEAAKAGVWEWDVQADELTVDDSLDTILVAGPEDVERLDDLFDGIIHADDIEALGAAIERAIVDLEPFNITVRVRTTDGGTRWLESRGRTVTNDAGEPVRILGIAIDVTERKEREQELERYERIVETAPDPIYALDATGEITLANEAFAELLGVDSEAMVGTNITEHLSPENVVASLEHIQALVERDADRGPLELTTETPSGPRQYEVNIALHPGTEDGALPGTIGVAHDVTDRRERERLLRRAQRAVESSGHAIYITDSDGTIVYANPAFEQVTGFSIAEAIGQSPSILNAGDRTAEYYDELWSTILSGEVWDEEIVNRRKNGENYFADQTIAPITDEDGTIEGFVGIQTDVTEHKDRLQQLQVMDRVLRHNLHNALNVVLGHADLIADATEGRPAEDAATIAKKGQELLDLTDKQRSITKSLSTEPRIDAVDLVPLIELIVEDLREAHPAATIEPALPPEAVVRATDDIEKAIRELLLNAIEHADVETPTVALTVETGETAVEVRVADQGPGIPEMEQEVVTGEQSIEPLYHGSGLGLWLVAWIVRRSGGSLEFESNVPKGTTVVISLERADAA